MDADRDQVHAGSMDHPSHGSEPSLKPDVLQGALIKDRYLVEKQLGRGGFGVAYLARDTQLHSRLVVVKVLLDNHAENAGALKKFRQELEALARINHPGVVGPLDYGELPDGRPFLVMEFIHGVRLRETIEAKGMEFGRVGRIIQQIGRALNAAHEQGIWHRDVKPENIMLQAPGQDEEQAKLIDFGIASVRDSQVSSSTTSNRISGSWGYMAPEQFEGKPLSPASDVYALGAVAYEMVTGRHPFNAESEAHLVRLQIDGVKLKPRDLRPSLPEPAEECILKALSVLPEDRFARARDFGDALARALADYSGSRRVRTRGEAEDKRTLDAHFLFLDLVANALLPNEQQMRNVELLQRLVRETPEFFEAKANDRLLRLPTGDGMALVFFGDPVPAVSCAASLATAIGNHSHLKVRIGLNTGRVYRTTDINTASNVVGDGINMAQRVMNCGAAGQILLSRSIAEGISQLPDWAHRLQDIGEREVKHGVRVHLFSLRVDGSPAAVHQEDAPPVVAPQRDCGKPLAAEETVRGEVVNVPHPKTRRWVWPTLGAAVIALLIGLVVLPHWTPVPIQRTEPLPLSGVPSASAPIVSTTATSTERDSGQAPVPIQDTGVPSSLAPVGTAPKTDPPSGLHYVRIPPGHAALGGAPGANTLLYLPPRAFQTDGFWMGETEVTVRAYLEFARTTSRSVPSPPVIAGKVFNANWASADFPMVMVDWRDANDFCQWEGGRLPSEFDWEYAARGGTAGPAYGLFNEVAWWGNNSGPHAIDSASIWNKKAKQNWDRYEQMIVDQGVTIHPVGQKRANDFGLRDMLGNVGEWTADTYTPDSTEKVARGGAWSSYGPLDVAQREGYVPTTRNGYLGFRCMLLR